MRRSVWLFGILAAVPCTAHAQTGSDSLRLARGFAIAVVRDLPIAASSPPLCVVLTAVDAPDVFLTVLRDSIRARAGAQLAVAPDSAQLQLRALHFALTPQPAALEIRVTTGRPSDSVHAHWPGVYFAARDGERWRVQCGRAREAAHGIRAPLPLPQGACLLS